MVRDALGEFWPMIFEKFFFHNWKDVWGERNSLQIVGLEIYMSLMSWYILIVGIKLIVFSNIRDWINCLLILTYLLYLFADKILSAEELFIGDDESEHHVFSQSLSCQLSPASSTSSFHEYSHLWNENHHNKSSLPSMRWEIEVTSLLLLACKPFCQIGTLNFQYVLYILRSFHVFFRLLSRWMNKAVEWM